MACLFSISIANSIIRYRIFAVDRLGNPIVGDSIREWITKFSADLNARKKSLTPDLLTGSNVAIRPPLMLKYIVFCNDLCNPPYITLPIANFCYGRYHYCGGFAINLKYALLPDRYHRMDHHHLLLGVTSNGETY